MNDGQPAWLGLDWLPAPTHLHTYTLTRLHAYTLHACPCCYLNGYRRAQKACMLLPLSDWPKWMIVNDCLNVALLSIFTLILCALFVLVLCCDLLSKAMCAFWLCSQIIVNWNKFAYSSDLLYFHSLHCGIQAP